MECYCDQEANRPGGPENNELQFTAVNFYVLVGSGVEKGVAGARMDALPVE